jgi:hypothetical protein
MSESDFAWLKKYLVFLVQIKALNIHCTMTIKGMVKLVAKNSEQLDFGCHENTEQ